MQGTIRRRLDRLIPSRHGARWLQATAAMALVGAIAGPLIASPEAVSAHSSQDMVNSPARDVTFTDTEPNIAELLGLSEEQSARRIATSKGQRVELVSRRTETSSTYVNPDGTLTSQAYAGPIRVKQEDGSWDEIDTALIDGGSALEPQTAAADITVSDGGDKRLASVSQGGASLTMGWEDTLPEPQVSDDTASYAIGDEQTLNVTALKEGFSQNVTLDSAPTGQLSFRIPVTLKGLTLSESGSGHLLLKDSAGDIVAEAPAPMMWDSSVDAKSGESQHLARIDTEVETASDGRQALVLRPDPSYFDQNLTYPVIVDPTTTLAASTDTWVATNYPDSQVSSTELKSGTYDAGVTKARSYLKFDVSRFAGLDIIDTNLALFSTWSSSCEGGSGTVVRRVTENWASSTVTWGTQPAATATGEVISTAAKGFSTTACPAGTVSFDIDAIVRAWTSGSPNYGVVVRGVNEDDSLTWRRYRSANYASGSDGASEPHLTVTYNSHPEVPPATALSPATTSAGTKYVTSLTPVLSTRIDDVDPGARVRVQYAVAPDPVHNDTTYTLTADSAYVDSGEAAAFAIPADAPLKNGTHLRLRARTYDGTDFSKAWSAWQTFTVDTSKAPAPKVPASPAAGAVETPSPILTGVVTAAVDRNLTAEFLVYNAAGELVLSDPLTTDVQDGDRAAVQVPEGRLTNGSSYRWKMRSCSNGVCSAYTALQEFTLDVSEENTSVGAVPSAVTGLKARAGEHGALVTWTPASATETADNPITYTVTARASDGTTVAQTTTTDRSAVFNELHEDAGDATYTFAVAATNSSGTGPSTTSNAILPVTVPGGTSAYTTALEAYHFARGGLIDGSYTDATDAAANSAYGPQFVSYLAKGEESALRERIAAAEDDTDNARPEIQLSDVLALPSTDGSTVTVRATVDTNHLIVNDVSAATAAPTDEIGRAEMQYTFTAGEAPVLLTATSAPASEWTVQRSSAALADFGNGVEQLIPDEDPDPSVFDGDSLETGTGDVGPVSFDALQAGSYSRTGAATWAVANWDAKPMYSSDCTNFVSRAIHHGGGVREKGDGGEWYRSTDAWWRNPGQWGHDETLSWINAAYFKTFFYDHMLASKRSTSTAYVGDVIFYDWTGDGKIDHTSIITLIKNGNIYVSQHTKAYKYRSFAAQRKAEPKMKFWIYRPKPEWY
ncbi:DNRLRE domain-containing protein [Streptomyces sp. NPDC002640]